jgi:hypothetical protein
MIGFDMQVELGELLAFGGSMIGGGWLLLKIAAYQYEKRLDERFEAIKSSMDSEFKLINEKTKGSSKQAEELMQVKLDFANYKTHVAEYYATKTSLAIATDKNTEQFTRAVEKIESQIEKLFKILEHKEDRRTTGQ